MNTPRSQRWRDRRDSFVPASTVINTAEYAVDVVEERAAKAFVIDHHYSGTFPASRLSVGLFRSSRLVGVCTFSVPMNNAAIPLHTGLADPLQGVDLGRFVLLDEVAGNGETWFLSRAFKALRREKPGVLSVISYADPVPRMTAAGILVKPGHVGQIYQAMSASYRGRAKARTEHLTPDGQPFSERAASKIKARERGYAYAVDELVRRGAPKPDSDDLRTWYTGLVTSGFFTRRRHPGNHVYAFSLTRAAQIAGRPLLSAAYPRLAVNANSIDATALPLFAA